MKKSYSHGILRADLRCGAGCHKELCVILAPPFIHYVTYKGCLTFVSLNFLVC